MSRESNHSRPPERPIFFDPTGRRWRHVRRVRLLLAAIVTGLTRRQQKAQHAEQELKHALKTRPAAPKTLATPTTLLRTPRRIGFFVNSDDSSYSSLKRNLGQLDWVVPEWLHLQDGTDPLSREIDARAGACCGGCSCNASVTGK